MNIYWTDNAIEDLLVIREYIAQNSRESSDRVIDNLTNRSEQIAAFPFSGRIVPEYEDEQIREVIEGSYRIIYYLESEQVSVIAVRHGSRPITLPEQ